MSAMDRIGQINYLGESVNRVSRYEEPCLSPMTGVAISVVVSMPLWGLIGLSVRFLLH